jgi:hypothetical protein
VKVAVDERTGQSGAPPRQPTVRVLTQSTVGELVLLWHRTVRCATGQVMFTVRCASDSALWLCAHCSSVTRFCSRPLERVVVAPVAHRTVRWIISKGVCRNPRVAGLSCTVLAHRTCPVAHRTVRCAVPQHTLVSFSPLYLIPNLNVYWFCVEPFCTCRTCILEQTS